MFDHQPPPLRLTKSQSGAGGVDTQDTPDQWKTLIENNMHFSYISIISCSRIENSVGRGKEHQNTRKVHH